MSVSVIPSSNNNLYADLQSLLQQGAATSGSTGPQSGSAPEFLIFAVLPPGTDSTASTVGSSAAGSSSTGSSGAGGTSTSGNSNPQFSPQTLEALLGMQGNGSNPQLPLSDPTNGGAQGSSEGTWWQQGQRSQGWHNHFHGRAGARDGLFDLLNAADSGATAQTATNANGSTSTTITYADGSTVTLTTAAPSTGSGSSGSSGSSSSGSGVTTDSSTTGATGAANNSTSQFAPQTLEALIAAQANALSSQSLLSELTGGGVSGGGNPTSGQQTQGQSSFNGASGGGGLGIGSAENLLAMLTSGDSGATSQVTDNPNGSTTTTISYADGSSVTLTTAVPSTSPSISTGSGSSESADASSGSSNLASYNLIEQMIQIQAQLLKPTTTQSVTA